MNHSASGIRDLGKKRPSGTAEVVQKIRDLIKNQGLRPETKLPPERVLAVQLKVGRPAVREAIKALSMLDVLESRRGNGTYIRSLAGLFVGWSVKLDKIDENFDMIELIEVRRILEPRAAALAAARADNKQLREIERELLAQETHSEYHDVLVRFDHNFHDAIIRASGNKILYNLAQVLVPLLLKSRQITSRTTPDMSKVLKQHRAIFEAIRLGETELAERAMREHLDTVAMDLILQIKR